MNKQGLLDLREDIDEAKDKVNRLEGRKEHLLQQLKEDWDCDSIEEAKQLLQDLKQEVEEMEQKIKEAIQELKEKYDVG